MHAWEWAAPLRTRSPPRLLQVTTHAKVDFEAVARAAARAAGYTSRDAGFCADTAEVKVLVDEQSPEIAQVGQP
jgi:S-adenosylmethionine synthetase